MVRTNLPLCETHMSDDEIHEWIINPEKWRVFASHHSSLFQELAAQHIELE
jgi:hypothetical protein